MNQIEEEQRKRDFAEQQSFVASPDDAGSLLSFNLEHGYLEAILRGFRSGFLRESEYRQMCQCESLEDLKLVLGDTDYCQAVQSTKMSEVQLSSEALCDACWAKFVDEFFYLRNQAHSSLATFMQHIQFEYMLSNISFLIVGLIKGGQPDVLLSKCDPIGKFPHMRSILSFENSDDGLEELYRTVLVDTPVGKYFERFFDSSNGVGGPGDDDGGFGRAFNEEEISIVSNTLKKIWLEDFYAYTQTLGGETAQAMRELLSFEADKRAIQIMINSFHTPLNDPFRRDTERRQLFCSFGGLYPDAIEKFSRVGDTNQLLAVLQPYTTIRKLWATAEQEGRDVEDVLYEYEVHLNKRAFEGQSHFACFWAYCKLKEQEKRNVFWITECISQGLHDPATIGKWIKVF